MLINYYNAIFTDGIVLNISAINDQRGRVYFGVFFVELQSKIQANLERTFTLPLGKCFVFSSVLPKIRNS